MSERRVHAHGLVGEVAQAVHVGVRVGGGGDEPSAAASAAPAASTAAGPVVRAGHQGERRRREVVHDVRRLQVLVVVVVMVVVVVGQGDSGRRRAWHGAHRVVCGVGLERVRLALGHGDVHGRQSLSPGQQGLIQAGKYVALQLQGRILKKKKKKKERGGVEEGRIKGCEMGEKRGKARRKEKEKGKRQK